MFCFYAPLSSSIFCPLSRLLALVLARRFPLVFSCCLVTPPSLIRLGYQPYGGEPLRVLFCVQNEILENMTSFEIMVWTGLCGRHCSWRWNGTLRRSKFDPPQLARSKLDPSQHALTWQASTTLISRQDSLPH